ncbi:MAG: OmpA family protein [Pseudomonadota bacterium]
MADPVQRGADGRRKRDETEDTMFQTGCLFALVAAGAIAVAALVSIWTSYNVLAPDEEATTAPAPAAPAPEPDPEPAAEPAPEPEVPEGSGVTATERDGKPMLTVYFDSGATEVTPDFETVSATLREYLDANPGASVAISGFNDPTGNAEINERLSKERAENVQAQLTGLGIAEDRTELVKPDDTTSEELSNAEARRVEITIAE